MHRFWDEIIEPLLVILQPETIVEIGSESGNNTARLLEFCKQNGATLHTIDPQPKFDVAAWREQYSEHFVFHQSLSLNAIPKIDRFDVVLIDGDHNWYTVFNELKLIERQCANLMQPFPLLMVHDIGWPYGRRDLYYNPENIPDAYRKSYKQKGMQPGSAELLDEGGLNPDLFNAISEKDLQNGVLTAVEDFLKETEERLELIKIPGLYGFGIIVSLEMKERNNELVEFLKELDIGPVVKRHIEKVENDRIEKQLSVNRRNEEIERIRAKYKEEIRRLKSQLDSQAEELERFQGELKRQYQDIEMLSLWIGQLDHGISALLSSRRWRFADAIGEIRRKALVKPQVPMASDHLHSIMQEFRTWKKGYGDEKHHSLQSSEKAFSKSATTSIAAGSRSVDIVVCVHNALDDVKVCLESIIKSTSGKYKLYIVNDGSDASTTEYLRSFSSGRSCILLENPVSEGYSKAANKGLRASTADYVILLNSDTIVPNGWVEKLLECAESHAQIGIIGPLSNAASWQSVPELFDSKGDWAINILPDAYDENKMAQVVSLLSEKHFPRVPFINGFCFAIKRAVIETIGYFDDEIFPKGYGEEDDYCLRAANANFTMAIADHAYIYHAKSKSYSHQRRLELSKEGNEALKRKHSGKRISELTKLMRYNPTLELMRQKIKQYIKNPFSIEAHCKIAPFGILFLLPVRGGGGGSHSVVQEAMGMRRLGVNVQVAVKRENMLDFYRNYPLLSERDELFYCYDNVDNLVSYACQFNLVIATVFHSVQLLKKIVETHPSVMPAYYVQDYEPWLFGEGSKDWKLAYDSYTLIPETVFFAKTQWLCDMVEKRHGVKVDKVSPSIDHEIYFPTFQERDRVWPVRVVAMIRPSTPRRGADRTMRLLKKLKLEFDERVSIHVFGCTEGDPKFQLLERDFEFNNHGILIREEVAQLLREAGIFLDLSEHQAFGRTGIEAMACGCAVVLPTKGGTHEYAVDRENALLVDTGSEYDCYGAITELVSDSKLRGLLRRNAVLKAAEYSIHRSAISELTVLKRRWHGRAKEKAYSYDSISKKDKAKISSKIRVLGILPRNDLNKFFGSSYIRLILPLGHASLRARLEFSPITVDEMLRHDADVMVVQRTGIPDEQTAHSLIDYCQHRGIRTVYETDDHLFGITSSHIDVAKYGKLIPAAKIFAMHADMITVPSDRLKVNLGKLNTNVRVIPNALDEQIWLPSNQRVGSPSVSKGRLRMLYMGTRTHMNDLLLVEVAMKKILAEYGEKVALDIVGVVPKEIKGSWFNVIPIPAYDYLQFVQWLHEKSCWAIGIAPIEDTEFNRCKSYIKYLDYSALGLATICSDLEPYQAVVEDGVNGVLTANSMESWYHALKSLIDDEDRRSKIADKAHRDFVENHTLKTQVQRWSDAFLDLLNSV